MTVGAGRLAFSGAVLCGGASRRMGRDKALVEVDGRALAVRVAEALRAAGAADVVAVGGDAARLAAVGLEVVADDAPGEGPLGGIVTALSHPGGPGGADVVFVAACDLVSPSPAAIAATVAALGAAPEADASVPEVDGRRQWLHAAWRRGAAAPLAAAFADGVRAVHAAVAAAGLHVVAPPAVGHAAVADADVPGDLPPGG